jgi:coproporphyrinogen III oxidase-like Fe-S oxidoreductase
MLQPDTIAAILSGVRMNYFTSEDMEITMEANPTVRFATSPAF